MAKNILPVNFQDDVLSAEMDGKRRYRKIENADGTISLEDVTEYEQVGSIFGQMQINATNEAVNESADKNRIIDSSDDLLANTQTGMIAGALAVKAVESRLSGNITALNQKISSFEQTKSEIANSALGKALGMLATWTWAQIVAALKAVVNRGTLNWSGTNTAYTIQPGYYPGGTLDSRPSYANGYNAGYSAGAAAKTTIYKTGSFTINRGVSVALGFQPNLFIAFSAADYLPIVLYSTISGAVKNNLVGASNTYIQNPVIANSSGITFADRLFDYAEGRSVVYFAAKII